MSLFIFGIPAWIFWLILVIVFFVVEVATINLVTIWFVIGSVAAMALALLGFPLYAQVLAMFIVSGISLYIFWRFRDKIKLSSKTTEKTNADRIIGEEGVVLEQIDGLNATGQIKVMGQIWSATSADGEKIQKDSIVRVIELKGVKAVVIRK